MFAEGLLQLCVPQEQSIEKQDWGWQTGSLQNRVSVSPSPGSTEAGGGSAPSFSLLMSTRDLSPKSLMQARMSRAGQTVAALTWSPSLRPDSTRLPSQQWPNWVLHDLRCWTTCPSPCLPPGLPGSSTAQIPPSKVKPAERSRGASYARAP
jgi:hypothetical protein